MNNFKKKKNIITHLFPCTIDVCGQISFSSNYISMYVDRIMAPKYIHILISRISACHLTLQEGLCRSD